MGYVKCWTMALSVILAAGCSSQQPPPPPKTVFDPLTQQLDKARDVQKTVDENAEKARQAVDAQESDAPKP